MINEDGNTFTEEFTEKLPEMLGDAYYNDPDTKQQPTKMFDNIKDVKGLVNMAAMAQRKASAGEKQFEEKLKGMVRIPGEGATAEDIAAFNTARGVPDSADKYELPIPEGDDKAGFEAVASVVKAAALKAGISQKALTPVWTDVVTALTKQTKDIEAKGFALIEADTEALKTEMKENYDAFIRSGDAALAKLKNGAEFVKLLKTFGLTNYPAVRKLSYEIAPFVLEGKTVLGGSAPGDDKAWFTDYSEVDQQ